MPKEKTPRRGISLGATAMGLPTKPQETVPVGKGFRAGINGLEWDGKPSFDSWAETGKTLRVIERGAQFAIGDFLNYGEDRFNERASQIVDASEGWSEKTCSVYRWVASRIARADRRMDRLTIAHHLLVAALTPVKQRHWLKLASDDEMESPWTVARLRKALHDGEDAPITGWWCLVLCNDQADQSSFQTAMEAQGRTCKAVMKRGKKKED
jgi:hypothetical protein